MTCGFLSKHPQVSAPSPRYYEIEADERRGRPTVATLFTHRPDLSIGHIGTELVCFFGRVNFMSQIKREVDQGERDRKTLSLIAEDRHCEAWYPYTPGFSPREHYEQLDMQRIEDDRRAFEMKLFEISQDAQKASIQIAQDSKAIVADLKAIAEKNDRFSRRVTVWVILLAVLQVVGALVALPSVSWVQRLWHHLFG